MGMKKINWNAIDPLLGKYSDTLVAKRFGISIKSVGLRRDSLDIPKYSGKHNKKRICLRRTSVECVQCGSPFVPHFQKPQGSYGKYCSKECYHESRAMKVRVKKNGGPTNLLEACQMVLKAWGA